MTPDEAAQMCSLETRVRALTATVEQQWLENAGLREEKDALTAFIASVVRREIVLPDAYEVRH